MPRFVFTTDDASNLPTPVAKRGLKHAVTDGPLRSSLMVAQKLSFERLPRSSKLLWYFARLVAFNTAPYCMGDSTFFPSVPGAGQRTSWTPTPPASPTYRPPCTVRPQPRPPPAPRPPPSASWMSRRTTQMALQVVSAELWCAADTQLVLAVHGHNLCCCFWDHFIFTLLNIHLPPPVIYGHHLEEGGILEDQS